MITDVHTHINFLQSIQKPAVQLIEDLNQYLETRPQ